ncbi:ABC transporter permease subunit [Alkalihalobacterium chitinilyticum]|uniref:ABC transporter permease subunit n=1 Tax=Alkalihalobacterium chitinilyticum TaxID=2980103 RepID=A0ABT5VL95_9BACI|nr:ABC transporter permease subunit [Alkalihalobacterium chitinilyticum]MDE5415996.1 ABC transporter permease subunit [Alkalihalobacterium chitinilyticum]
MVFAKELFKTCLGWVAAILIIILLVFIPRDLGFEFTEYEIKPVYTFSLANYLENLKSYSNMIFIERTLGETRFGSSVFSDVITFGGRSLTILAIAFCFALIFGVLKGFFDYATSHSKWSVFGHHMTFTLQALPDFFLIILVQVFLLWLISIGFPHFSLYGYESWHNFLLAGWLLSFFPTMYMARIVSSSLEKERTQPYVVTGKSKGLTNLYVLRKHQFGNSIIQVFPHIPTMLLYALSNILIIEYLLYFPGAGYRLYQALGFGSATIGGGVNRTPFDANYYEPELVIAIVIVFISLVAFVQLICKLFMYRSPLWKGGGRGE